jgi:hypothetical protein
MSSTGDWKHKGGKVVQGNFNNWRMWNNAILKMPCQCPGSGKDSRILISQTHRSSENMPFPHFT